MFRSKRTRAAAPESTLDDSGDGRGMDMSARERSSESPWRRSDEHV
jgi:hypothetical protein